MSLNRKIRNLDVFKKVPADLSQASNLGGAVSLVTAALIVFFTVRELRNYLSPEYVAEISLEKLVTREEMK